MDTIYIATPPVNHKEYTIAAAKANKPVYVEKPMARNYRECQEMIDICKEYNVPLFVAYYRRAQPRFLKVKNLIENGSIGIVLATKSTHLNKPIVLKRGEVPWRVRPEISGGGLFFDLASHTLNLLDFLVGPMISAQGYKENQSKQYEAEDIVTGSFVYESGAQGTGVWCFSAYENSDRNEIIGTKGKIFFQRLIISPFVL